VESAWIAIRYDEQFREYYEENKKSKSGNKAIIKVAAKLTRSVIF